MIRVIIAIVSAGLTLAVLGAVLVGYVVGFRIYSVQSGSMRPAIQIGDAVLVRKASADQTLQLGQLVTYRSTAEPAVLITHRIQALRGSAITTKGDALQQSDATIDRTRLVGQPIARLANLGIVLDALRKPLLLLICVYVPITLIIAAEIGLMLRVSRPQTYQTYVRRQYSYRSRTSSGV